MFCKTSLLFFILILSTTLIAQNIKLQKNGYNETFEIKISKKITIKYKKDTSIITLTERAFKYEFPYIYFKNEHDTLKIDVRNIETLSLKSPYIYCNYTGLFFTGNLSLLIIAAGFKRPNFYASMQSFVGSLIPISLSYLLIKDAHKKYNTKTEWSFY